MFGLVHERPGQVDAAAHAAGVRADLALPNAGQPHEIEQLVGAVVGLGATNAIEAPLQHQEIASLREIVQPDFLQGDADRRPDGARILVDVDAGNLDAAGALG